MTPTGPIAPPPAALPAPGGRRHFGALYKSAMLLSFADVAAKGASGVLTLLIARFLGADLYGDFAIATSVSGLFLMITAIGFEQELTRRGGKSPASVPATLKLNLAGVLIANALTLSLLSLFLAAGPYTRTIALLTIIVGATQVLARYFYTFRYLGLVLHRSSLTAAMQSAIAGSLFVATLSVILAGRGLMTIALAQLGVTAAMLALWVFLLPRDLWRAPRATLPALAAFTRSSLPFAVSNIVWIAYFNFDTFLLSLLRPAAEVGVYAGVYKIVGMSYTLGYSVANAFTPHLFHNHSNGPERYGDMSRHLLEVLAAIGAALALAFFFGSDLLVRAVLGGTFREGAIVLRILSASVLFRLLNFGLCEILTTSGRQGMRVTLETLLLAANAVSNLLLIPLWGGRGAAWATVVSEILLFLAAARAAGLLSRSRRVGGRPIKDEAPAPS